MLARKSICTAGRTIAGALAALVLALACQTPALADEAPQASAPDYTAFEDAPALAAPEVIIEDADGQTLFSRSADSPMPMASTTKVMTAVVALESGLPLDTVCTVSEYAASNQGTVVGYAAGSQASLRELLEGMLVHSGGDAAVAIAEAVAGSEEAFVARMNQRAAELGLSGTHYTSPDGFSDQNHYSTPRDLVTLARHAMQMPLFKSIVGSKSVTLWVNGEQVTFTNTDVLLNAYPGMQGIKTGFTYGAGRTFVGLAQRGGQQVWFALLGEGSDEARTADMWALLDWAFSKCAPVKLVSAETPALGYVTAGYRFGAVLPTSIDADAYLRRDPLGAGSPSISRQAALTSRTTMAMPDQVLAVLSWTTDGKLACARSVRASHDVLAVRIFSPFVAPLFYELDAAGRA